MKIGIVSLGLIGGSILKSLVDKGFDVFVVTSNDETLNKAKVYTEHVSKELSSLVSCEVVFVCSPISATLSMLDKLENILSSEAIVADVASVKGFLMQKQRPYKFIGSHPMAGTEHSGFDSSFCGLFENVRWVLTPDESAVPEDIALLSKIIRQMGAIPVITDADSHDEAVALISHFPMILSQALFSLASANDLALKLASSGFRDMTRLAMSNSQMANDMLLYNSKNIEKAYKELGNAYKGLLADYSNKIPEIISERSLMYNSDGKNISD